MGHLERSVDAARIGPETAARDRVPLRVALCLDSFVQPAWARKIVADIQASPFARICLVVRREAPRASLLATLWRDRGHLLHDAYVRLDARIFRGEPDALAPTDVQDLLAACPVTDGSDPAHLRSLGLDVALAFAQPADALAESARYGVWSVHGGSAREVLPGLREVMEARGTTAATLEVRSGGAGPKAVSVSYGPTDHVSVTRNRNPLLWKSAALVLRGLRDLAADGPGALARAPDAPSLPPKPTNLVMAGLLLRLAARYLRGKVRDLLTREQWYLAYGFEDPSAPRDDFRRLVEAMPPKDCYWADPFPVRTDDGRSFLFFEELRYRDPKGRILGMEISEEGAGRPFPVLERPYHLSYPHVFRWEGRYYMVPESSENRTVTLFRCESFPDRWVEEKVLLRDLDAVDATLEEIDGCWWMFLNAAPFGAGNRDELHLFHAETPLGPWTPHRRNPVKSDCRGARPAGRLFRRDGQIFRPAQNCSGAYGSSIVIQRVDLLSKDDYRETAVAEVLPTWDRKARRVHTLNRQDGIVVLDLLRQQRRFP
jgi:hypothetical protein